MNTVEGDSFDVKHSSKSVGEGKLECCASVTWKIANFSLRARKANEQLISQEFSCSDATWVLILYPNELRSQENIGNVGIYLKKTLSNTQDHIVDMKSCIPYKGGENTKCTTKVTFKTGDPGWGHANIVCRSEVLRKSKGYLLNDVLTIIWDISVSSKNELEVSSTGTAKTLIDQNLPQKKDTDTNALSNKINKSFSYHESPTEEDNLRSLSKHFETLYTSQRFSDVILKAGKHEFPAHKLVLRSRSKVFEAMFEHDMQENRQATVDLIAMEVDTVKDMLRYIYCGKVRQLAPGKALQLYVAADRYDLQELVLYCRKIILCKLSIDNICEVYAIADLHHDQVLMDAVKSLLFKRMKEILKTNKWKKFTEEYTHLSLKLLQSTILSN